MKKAFALLLACVMMVGILSGCGSKSESSGSTDSSSAPEEKSVTLKIHCDYTEDHPTAQLLAEFCQR